MNNIFRFLHTQKLPVQAIRTSAVCALLVGAVMLSACAKQHIVLPGDPIIPPTQEEEQASTASSQQQTMSAGHTKGTSVRAQLYKSANRPLATQPEKDFALHAPEVIWGGEPFIVSLQGEGLKQISVTWRNKTVTAIAGKNGQSPHTCEVVLAPPLDGKDAFADLVVTAVWAEKTETMRARLPIKNRTYPVQKLTVAQKYVTPDPSVLERIKRDRQKINAVLREITPHKYWELPFKRPVPGAISSIFGLRRVFNGQPRNPHKGLDFRARAGDPIMAIESGRVALVADHYYGGNTVIIDHGLGLYSLYLHMSAFDVAEGDEVTRGQPIGRIGSTGRSTGPHLHLSLSVLGESVDPAPTIEGLRTTATEENK